MVSDNKRTYKTVIDAKPEKVWEGLTKPELVKQYFFGTNQQSTYKKGDKITWDGEYNDQKYHDKGVILESEPGKRLVYTYLSSFSGKEDKPENYLWIEYLLTPVDDRTELALTFTSYNEEGAKHSESNWKMVIDGLKKVLAED